ncbi:EamA family transporter [Thermosulfurimonas dismutans]|uniref:EamA domain-containing protein n=1 Tax=Thermosulfurimonas dismutans TaxID=999894 RepID=A0A179D5U1_9BACT|nr:EamA family transporter [Thermosulfurimonas dismutans]OAQ21464.1 hypothetical protein TDIS_0685 [Thermosulfurimonas dismutans]
MDGRVVLLWVLTLFFWGSSPLLEKVALKAVSPLLALAVRTGVAALILVLVALLTGEVREVQELSLRNVLVLGASGLLAGVLGMFTYFSLLKTGAASKIVPLTAAYPLVTAFMALVFLKEDLSWERLLGILLTVTGLIILQKS